MIREENYLKYSNYSDNNVNSNCFINILYNILPSTEDIRYNFVTTILQPSHYFKYILISVYSKKNTLICISKYFNRS